MMQRGKPEENQEQPKAGAATIVEQKKASSWWAKVVISIMSRLRPEAGKATIVEQMKASFWWADVIISNMSWLLVGFALLVILLPLPNQVDLSPWKIVVVLGIYSVYMLGVRNAALHWGLHYNSRPLVITRIIVNIIVVSSLVYYNLGQSSYFWLFYTFPIFQAITYLGTSGVLMVIVAVLASYGATSLIATEPPFDVTLFVFNSLLMLVLSLAFSSIFRLTKDLTRLRMLSRVDERIGTATSLDEILQVTLEEGLWAVGAKEGSIMVLDPETNNLKFKAWVVQGEFRKDKLHKKFESGEGIAGTAVATKQAYNCPDIRKDENFVEPFTNRKVRSLLSVPIVSRGRVLYVINVDSEKKSAFKKSDIELLSVLATHIAFAIESKRLQDLGLFLPMMTLDQLCMRIVESACMLIGTDTGSIFLPNKQTGKLEEVAHYPSTDQPEVPRERGLTYQVMNTGKPITVNDVQGNPRVKTLVKEQGIKALMSAPLNVRDEHGSQAKIRTIGALSVNAKQDIQFSKRDELLLESIASLAAIAVDNARLIDDTKEKATQLRQLHAVTEKMLSMEAKLDLPGMLDFISEQAVNLVENANAGGILLLDDEKKYLTFKGTYNLSEKLAKETRDKVGTSIAGSVVEKRHAIIENDISNSMLFSNPAAEETDILAMISTPLWRGNEIIGVLDVHSQTNPRAFHEDDLQILSLLASHAAIAIANTENLRFKESLLSSATDAIVATNRKGVVVEFNAVAQKILGYKEMEAIGENVAKFYGTRERTEEVLELLLKDQEKGAEGLGGILLDHSTFVQSKAGELIPILLSASLLGEGGSVGFFRDLREIERYQRSIRRLNDLLKAGQAITRLRDSKAVLETTVEKALEILKADTVSLHAYDQLRQEFYPPPVRIGNRKEWPVDYSKKPDSSIRRIIEHGEIYFTETAQTDSLVGGGYVLGEGIQASAACPLKVGDTTVGVLFCNYREAHPFTNEEKLIIELFASEAAVAIENANLYEQTKRRLNQIIALNEVGLASAAKLSLSAVLQTVVDGACVATQAQYGALGIIGPEGKPQPFVTSGMMPEEINAIGSPPEGRGVLGRILQENDFINAPHIRQHSDFTGFPDHHPEITSFLSVPILSEEQPIGNLYIGNKMEAPEFSQEDVAILQALAAQATIAIEKARAIEEADAVRAINTSFLLLSNRAHTLRQLSSALEAHLYELRDALPEAIYDDILDQMDRVVQQLTMPGGILQEVSHSFDKMVSLSLLVNQVWSKYETSRKGEITLEHEIDETCFVQGNELLLEFAIQMLIENAVEAIEAKGEPGMLSVKSSVSDGNIQVSITDTGIGITPALQQRLFSIPIDRGNRLGYGAFTAAQIFRVHHGSIRIAQSSAEGSTIEFVLPLAENEPS